MPHRATEGGRLPGRGASSGGASARPVGRERWVLALGLVSAGALVWAALGLSADPDRAGEAALARVAGEVADGVVDEWQRLLRGPAFPVPPGDGERDGVTFGDTGAVVKWSLTGALVSWSVGAPLPVLTAEAQRPSGTHAAFDVLLTEAAHAEVRRSDPVGALELVQEALGQPDLDAPRKLLGHLRAIQLAGRLGEPESVAQHWSAARASDDGRAAVDDVALLLACGLAAAPHLDPAERSAAGEALMQAWIDGALVLPAAPAEASAREAGAAWRRRGALADRLAGLLPDTAPLVRHWREGDRAALTLHAWARHFGGLPDAPDDDRWHLWFGAQAGAGSASPGEARVLVHRAQRSGGDGSHEGAEVTVSALQAAFDDSLSAHGLLPDGFVVDHRGDDVASGELMREATPLGAGPLAFVLRHTDPGALAAAESARLRGVRIGLLVMAAACLGVALLTARSLRRERALAGLKSAFVAGVSHELRTPVASILLMAENLELGRVTDPAARQRYHGHIRAEARRLRRLVDDVLDFSRLERGHQPHLALEPVALPALVDEIADEARQRVEGAGLTLELRRVALPSEAVLDAEAVRRAVLNLVDNAVRHSGSPAVELAFDVQRAGAGAAAGARTRAGAGASAGAGVRADADADAGTAERLVIVVADRGRGVPADQREAVFAPFERLDEQQPGAGLGLSIVRALVRGHGGEVSLRGRADGPGAWFELSLPLAPAEVTHMTGGPTT